MLTTHFSSLLRKSFAVKGLGIIIFLFVVTIAMLVSIVNFDIKVSESIRAYIRGNGVWAQAQKEEMVYLHRYLISRNMEDYNSFLQSLIVTGGDEKARKALLGAPPDIVKAKRGFVQGEIDPEDLDAMIWLFLHFQNTSFLNEEIKIWTEADARADEIRAIGEELKQNIKTGLNAEIKVWTEADSSADEIRTIGEELKQNIKAGRNIKEELSRLKDLNNQLHVLDGRFTQVLSAEERWIHGLSWKISISVIVVFLAATILVSRKIFISIAVADQELLDSEARFSSLKNSNTIGIAVWDMSGQVLEANEKVLQMLGYTRDDLEAQELNWKNLTPKEYWRKDNEALFELKAKGRCEPYEKQYIHKTGARVPVYLGSSLLPGDQDRGIAFIVDLTKRKRAESQLLRKEHRLRAIFDTEPECITVLSPRGDLLEINRSGLRLFEVDFKALMMQYGLLSFICPEYREEFIDAYRGAPFAGQNTIKFEITTRKGTRRWLESYMTSIPGEDTARNILVISRDITERRILKEQEQQYLRTIRLLNECNALIVKRSHITDLLKDICRITVEAGGYLMAWIGYPHNDEDRTVSPIAQYGGQSGYLDEVNISWRAGVFGQGPSGTAIRTRKAVVSQNIMTDPNMLPWRDIADKYGYKSAIALPLIVNERIFGVFCIYSAKEDAFTDEEVGLLEELSDNIAFGIDAQIVQDEKGRAMEALERQSNKLERTSLQLRKLVGSYETSVENERKEIAREVHDELGQVLTSLHLRVSEIRLQIKDPDPEVSKIIGNLKDGIDHAIKVTRNVAESLRPAVVDMGIESALKWLSNNFSSQSGCACRFYPSQNPVVLDQRTTGTLFRIVQESLTNVARHANARKVSITMTSENGRCIVEISDDGVGFNQNKQDSLNSFGLIGMKERALMLAGELEIDSADGNGTTVSVSFPLSHEELS